MKANDFLKNTYGKYYDIDGYYGAQCWDYFAYLCTVIGSKIINCTSTGYVIDIWNNRKNNGVLDKFKEVPVSSLQNGDVVVFKNGGSLTPLSHIGVFAGWLNKGSTFTLQAQNQYGSASVNKGLMYVSDIAGCLRPKVWDNKSPDLPIKSKGKACAKYDYIRVRNKPSLDNSALTGDWHNTGMKLNYQNVVKADGWHWLEYVSSKTNKKHYVAYGTTDGKTVYWKID